MASDSTPPGHPQPLDEQDRKKLYDEAQDLPSPTGSTVPPSMKKYNMYYTPSMLNLTLRLGSSSGPCHYYMESSFLSTKPQIMLRTESKAGPMLAFARVNWTSRHMQIGSGDFKQDNIDKAQWEDLSRSKNLMHRSDYTFSTAEGSPSGKRQEFCWRKNMAMFGKTVYECVDESGELQAKMLSGGMFNWKKGGEIILANDLHPSLEHLLIVAAIAIWTMEALSYQSLFQGFDDSGKK